MKLTLVFTIFLVLAGSVMSGVARPGCFCPAVYQPVCGKDGNTYGNSCQMGCAGVSFAYDGKCRGSRY